MRVLLSNKYYYNRGGDCIASMAVEKLLKEKGHEVAFFSMQYPKNFTSPWETYFPSEVDFNGGGWQGKLKAAQRIFYSSEVKHKFLQLLDLFKPDVVHLNNIHSQLSPCLAELAHRKGIKVVWTLHDYKLVCPSYSCLRDGKPCEQCIHQGPFPVLKNRCMKNSLPASLLAYLEACFWNRKRIEKSVDAFICPSQFLANKIIEGGYSKEKVNVICNFTNRQYDSEPTKKQDYYCYVGRLSEEKGLHTLVDAANELPYKLKIIGDGPLKESLMKKSTKQIEFVGFKEWDELQTILQKSKFVVLPSEWYENNPLSIIESFFLGTPVLGANIGGIPELIAPTNGALFKTGDKADLKKSIQLMFNKEFNYKAISHSAQELFSADNYYNKLIKIYEQ